MPSVRFRNAVPGQTLTNVKVHVDVENKKNLVKRLEDQLKHMTMRYRDLEKQHTPEILMRGRLEFLRELAKSISSKRKQIERVYNGIYAAGKRALNKRPVKSAVKTRR